MDKIETEKFQQLMSSEEGITLDFKKSGILSNSFEFAKILTAFANTVGGFIMLGVCDDKSFENLKYSDKYIQNIVSISRDKCEPSLAPEIKVHEYAPDLFVYVIEIKKFTTVPHAVKGKDGKVYYIRVGESVREPTHLELQKLFDNRNQIVEKKPRLKPGFLNSEGQLVSSIEIFPEFPIIEEKDSLIPFELWRLKKFTEASVFPVLQNMNQPDEDSIKLDPVRLVIANEGDSPAENINITVIFPEQFVLHEESDLKRASIFVNLTIPAKMYGGLHKHETKRNVCEGRINSLGNDLQFELDPIFPEVPDEVKTYQVNIFITQNNHPKSEHILEFKVNPQHPKVIKEIEKPDKSHF